MKVKIEITAAEKRILYQIFAVLLCVFIILTAAISCASVGSWFNMSETAYIVLCVSCSMICSFILVAIWKVFGNK